MIHPKKMEHEQKIYQVLLDELLNSSSQAIVLINTDAEIIFCSPGIKSITEYETEELTGRLIFDFFHSPDLIEAKRQHQYFTKLKVNVSVSLIRIRNKQGHMIWIDAVVRNLLDVPEINALFVLLKRSCDAGAEEKKLVQAVMDGKEQEREFLASELHDNINQVITATKLLVDIARLSPAKEELMQLSSSNLQFVNDEIRKLSYSLVSYDLQEYGLKFAVYAFLTTISKASTVKFRAKIEENAVAALNTNKQLHVYRIIQEGTTNIIRHAEATMAEITLTLEKDMIYLNIIDNGKGFSMTRLKPGIGLSTMANRVKLLQGHFHVRMPQDTGTTIEIHFPV